LSGLAITISKVLNKSSRYKLGRREFIHRQEEAAYECCLTGLSKYPKSNGKLKINNLEWEKEVKNVHS
jgi:hypothetical protein